MLQEGKVDNIRNDIKEVKDQEASRKKKLDDCKKSIRSLEKECENPPREEASLEVGERSKQLRGEIQAIKEQILDLRGQYEIHSRAIDDANAEMNRAGQQ